MKNNNNRSKISAGRALLSVLVSASVTVPIICLPIGTREGTSPALQVRRAYAATFPEEELEEVETPVEDVEVDEYILNGGTISASYNEGYDPSQTEVQYRDVTTYIVYQAYDQSGLPEELLHTG